MSQHCKFYRQKKQIYLNGYWIDTGEYRKGDLYEMNSFDCGYIAEDWRVSGYTCVGTSKYQLEVKYISNNGMTWTATTDTRVGSLIESDSFDCGYIAEEWRNTGTMCYGLDKYYQQTKYITDNGTTWTATTDTRRGSLIESQSVDCLDPSLYKAVFYTYDGNTHGVKDILVYPCDGNTVLNNIPEQDGSWGGSYELIKVGNCVTEIADDAFYLTAVFHLELPENGNLTRIGSRAFSNTSLGYHDTTYTVRIPDTVQIIDNQAFDCVHVDYFIIGSGVTSIGHSAFDRSKATAREVEFTSMTPPTFGGGIYETFRCYGGKTCTTVKIPCGAYDAYWPVLSGGVAAVVEACFENIFEADYLNGDHYESEDPCYGISTITTATTNPSGYDYTAMTSCEIGLCANNIDEIAFSGFTNLQVVRKTSSHLQTPVEYIGERAFLGCTSLIDIDEITSGVTTIGNSAFSGCSSLSSVTIGKTIQYIDSNAFKGCTSLTGITIYSEAYTPETAQIISIGTGAFDNTNNCPIFVDCNYLYLYEASSSWAPYVNRLQAIPGTCFSGKFRGQYQFYDYPDLRTKEVECNSSTTLVSDEISNGYAMKLKYAEIGDCVDNINGGFGQYLVRVNSNVDGVANIPSGVTTFGDYVFNGCSGLTEINLPSGLTSIGQYTFSSCKNLTEINIPSGVTNIPSYAFQDCTKLSAVTMYSGATLNFWAFRNCGFKNLNIQYGNAGGTSIFSNCTGLTTANIKCFYVGDLAFQGCNNLSAVTINCSGTSQSAFSGLTGLKEATINATYSIGNNTFASCTNLSSLTLTSVATIGEKAFANCDKLTSVVIPDSTTRINSSAFNGCDNLESVTIGSGVTYIAQGAFSDNPKLATVTIYATTPPTLYNDTVFSGNKSGRVIYVPSGSVNAYKTAQYWTKWANSIYAIPT